MHPDHISNHLPDLEAMAPERSSGAPPLIQPVIRVRIGEVIGSGHYVCWVESPYGGNETLVGAHEDIRSTHKVFERIADFAADIAFESPIVIERVR